MVQDIVNHRVDGQVEAMTIGSEEPDADAYRVWERPEPTSRPAPSPLSRARIVGAAIAIADREGLAGVSLRKVGAALDAGAMRLYGYLSTKDELLELMVDAVYGEMASAGPVDADWRAAIRTIARRTWRAAREHPWFTALLGGRPHIGPNALAHLEASFAALSGTRGLEDIDVAMQALRTINAYVIGAIQTEASELRAELESGMTEAEWQTATGPYIERMLATGRFPNLAQVVRDAAHLPADVVFDQGLDWVLDGIAARLPR
jgi:AcrR family transcriptional regulator